tara:strand:+ start:11665 stop:12384 length:720 start_codon:yes stop_codon:yes gene_type:complete
MDTIQTPRELPENIEEWSDEIEELLSEWGEVAMCYAYLHNFGQRKYKKKYHHLQIPIIILSTLTGTANFATDSYVPTDFKQGFSAGVGSLNIFCGILGTLLSFLRYSEIYEGHRIAALAWSKLSRNIEIELSLQDKKRKPCRDFLKICRSEYDNLLESSPNIDLDIINDFNKKFNDKYPNVRKPVICNGLKSIEPYKLVKDVPKKKESVSITISEPDSPVLQTGNLTEAEPEINQSENP